MTKKIMVVDDEPHLRKLVAKILGKEGYNVEMAENGQECLNKLKKTNPDLLYLIFLCLKCLGGMFVQQSEKMND